MSIVGSVRRQSIWQIVGMATIICRTVMPEDAVSWLKPDASERTVQNFRNNVLATQHNVPM